MLERIGDASGIAEFIARAGRGEAGSRLPGFGQAVRGHFDPRTLLLRKLCQDVLRELELENERLFKLAMLVEKAALDDAHFVARQLHPNLDFYTGIILKALGVPSSMFTSILALARTAGWTAHWEEALGNPDCRIAECSA